LGIHRQTLWLIVVSESYLLMA